MTLSMTIWRGFGAADTLPISSVSTMQIALRRLAVKFQDHSLDPATSDGTVTIGTIVALANAAQKISTRVDPAVGAVVGHIDDAIDIFKKPFELVPYGDVIIDVLLSPWLVDKFYGALLAVIRVIPGGDGIADSIDAAITAVQNACTVVAAPIAAGIAAVLGSNLGDCSITDPLDCVADAAEAVAGLVADAANAVADAASSVGSALASVATSVWQGAVDAARDVFNAVEKFGCAIVNNNIVVGLAVVGTGIIASPATGAAVAAAAAQAKGACTVMRVVDLAYAIYKFLTNKFDPPPPLVAVSSLIRQVIASKAARTAVFAMIASTTEPALRPILLRPQIPLRLLRLREEAQASQVPLLQRPAFWIATTAGALTIGGVIFAVVRARRG